MVQFLNNCGYMHSLGAYFLSRVFGDGKRCWNHGQHSYALVRFLTDSFRNSFVKNHLNFFKSILGCARILSEIFMWHNQSRKRPLQTRAPTNNVKQCRTCFLYASLSLIVKDIWRSQIKIKTSQMERGGQIISHLGFGSSHELCSSDPHGNFDYGATPFQMSSFSCAESNA